MERCLRCCWEWIPRIETKPKQCPYCKSVNWKTKKETKCELCKKTFSNLNIHHKDGNHSNNKKNNLTEICTECHLTIHNGISKRNNNRGGYRGNGKWAYKNRPELKKRLLELGKVYLKKMKGGKDGKI